MLSMLLLSAALMVYKSKNISNDGKAITDQAVGTISFYSGFMLWTLRLMDTYERTYFNTPKIAGP